MSLQNTNYGSEKQSNREFVFKVFKKELRKNKSVSIVSFPAEQGLKGITSKSKPSFEGLVKRHFQNAELIGLEANKSYFKKLQRTCKNALSHIALIQVSDSKFFKKTALPIDGAWLDYFGGTSTKNQSTLKHALKNGAFSDKSVLAVTICDTPRTINCRSVKLFYKYSQDGTIENGHFNWFKTHAKRYGYKVSLIETFSYRNSDISSKANTMKTIAYRIETL